MVNQQVYPFDILCSLFYAIVILLIAFYLNRNKKENYNRFFIPFIIFKIFTAIIFVLIHVYYYGGGDTFLYFSGGSFFFEQFTQDPINYLKLLFTSQESIQNIYYGTSISYAINSSNDVYFFSKIVSVFNILAFNQYMTASILFTFMTAIGVWKLYATFCQLFPSMYKFFAIGILFYPSLGIWGSGILKDPLTLAAVSFIFASFYSIISGKKYLISAIIILLSIAICFYLKPYILYTFIPIMFLWTQGSIIRRVKNPLLKFVTTPILIAVFFVGGFYFLNQVSEGAGKYSLENVQSVAEGFHSWHTYLAETRDQSGYSLGNVEFTPLGVLRKAPEGFFVTYYRPFIIGDVRNVATLFEAVQTLVLLILTIFVFIKVGVISFFKLIISNHDVRTFMIFAIVFGVAVGLTSYNFGALSRYKIPSLPFFTSSLIIIYYLGYLKPKAKVT